MGKINLGINLEFVRHEDKPFEWGVEKAAELGYEYVEPMVHWGRELLSEAGYFHSVSMLDDPLRIKRACSRPGMKLSGLSAHTPLCKPEIGIEYLKQAIRFAAECGAPVVNTDEGPKPAWTTEDEDSRADALHAHGGGQGRRAARHSHRPGTAPAIQQTPRRLGPHLRGW